MWKARHSGVEQQRSLADHRNPYERDRTRLIHSAAFRRLQRKTQIFGTQEGDFHRTRLTHSLEVDSIARSLVQNLFVKIQQQDSSLLTFLPEDNLITAITLSHDIGHPPFGHGGESALNYLMREYGGFESNGQTLRLLTKLETSYHPFGLDLTRRTLLGIIKYPASYSALVVSPTLSLQKKVIKINAWVPPKCYLDEEQDEVDWILEPLSKNDKELFQTHVPANANEKPAHRKTHYHSLDCSIMNIADDIAYGVHDLEDAIYLKLISREQMDFEHLKSLFMQAFPEGTLSMPNAGVLIDKLFSIDVAERKHAIGDLVNGFITAVCLKISHSDFTEPLLRYTAELPQAMSALLEHFKKVVFNHVINSHEARTIEFGGQTVIQRLFEAVSSNPEQLLSLVYRENYRQVTTEREGMRVICDYIASMTDEYAHRMHERLFGFNSQVHIQC